MSQQINGSAIEPRLIALNTLAAMIGDVTTKAVGAVIIVLISRKLGVHAAGVYTLSITFAFLLRYSFLWGLDQLLTREVARDRTRVDVFWINFITIRVVFCLLAIASLALFLKILVPYPPMTTQVILIISLTVLTESITELCQAVYVAFERMEYLAATSLTVGVSELVAGGLAITRGASIEDVAWILVFVSAWGTALNVILTVRVFLHPGRWHLDRQFCRLQIQYTWPFALIGLFFILESQFDTVLLSRIWDETAVGWYALAVTLTAGLSLIPQAYRVAIFPALVRLNTIDTAATSHLYAISVKYLLLLAFPLATGMTIFAQPIITTVFGAHFLAAVPITQILIWSIVPAFVHILNGRLLLADKREVLVVRLLVGSLALNLIANFLFLPRWGPVGVATARVTSTLIVYLIGQYIVNQQLKAHSMIRLALRPALAAGLTAVALSQMKMLEIWIQLPLGTLMYALALAVLGTFSREDLQLLRQIIGLRMAMDQAAKARTLQVGWQKNHPNE